LFPVFHSLLFSLHPGPFTPYPVPSLSQLLLYCFTIVPSLEGTVHPNQRTVLGTVPRSLIVLRSLSNRFPIALLSLVNCSPMVLCCSFATFYSKLVIFFIVGYNYYEI
jgi:hypothetical protein